MALIFQVRGTSLDAHYSRSGKTPAAITNAGGTAPFVEASALSGVFGGSVIKFANGARNYLSYPGLRNFSENGAFAALVRIVPQWTGFPAVTQTLLNIGHADEWYGGFFLQVMTNGKIRVFLRTADGTTIVFDDTVPTWSATANVPADIMVSWDGLSGAGKVKVSIDGAEFHTFASSAAMATRNPAQCPGILIGYYNVTPNGQNFWLNELVLWDSAENHVYATRSDFTSASAFDGTDSTDPGVSNVVTGVSYKIDGDTYIGTRDVVSNTLTEATLGGESREGILEGYDGQ